MVKKVSWDNAGRRPDAVLGHHHIIAVSTAVPFFNRSAQQRRHPYQYRLHHNSAISEFRSSQSGNREMRIILRVGQRLDRRISGNKLAGRRTCLSIASKFTSAVPSSPINCLFRLLRLRRCRTTHAACHGETKTDITAGAYWLYGPSTPPPGIIGVTAQVAILVNRPAFFRQPMQPASSDRQGKSHVLPVRGSAFKESLYGVIISLLTRGLRTNLRNNRHRRTDANSCGLSTLRTYIAKKLWRKIC